MTSGGPAHQIGPFTGPIDLNTKFYRLAIREPNEFGSLDQALGLNPAVVQDLADAQEAL
jgi:hypothetical protein